MASKSTVYLLCIALLLLPAHVCLGFLDRSLGPTDHTCGERELSTRTSSSVAKKRGKNKKSLSTGQSERSTSDVFDTQVHIKACISCAIKLICGHSTLLE